MRIHEQDLTSLLKVKQYLPEALRYYIINFGKGKPTFVMYDMAHRQSRHWPATGVLDLHDVAQECYCALIRNYDRIDWEQIKASSNPNASLWAFLKKSVKLDVRKAVNTYKDGMRVPLDKIWEVKVKKFQFDFDNFFSLPFDSQWMHRMDEAYAIADDAPMTRWETEELYSGLTTIMEGLSFIERMVLEMSHGIDQLHGEKRSTKYMAKFFGRKERVIVDVKARALKKLRTEENLVYLRTFIEN